MRRSTPAPNSTRPRHPVETGTGPIVDPGFPVRRRRMLLRRPRDVPLDARAARAAPAPGAGSPRRRAARFSPPVPYRKSGIGAPRESMFDNRDRAGGRDSSSCLPRTRAVLGSVRPHVLGNPGGRGGGEVEWIIELRAVRGDFIGGIAVPDGTQRPQLLAELVIHAAQAELVNALAYIVVFRRHDEYHHYPMIVAVVRDSPQLLDRMRINKSAGAHG